MEPAAREQFQAAGVATPQRCKHPDPGKPTAAAPECSGPRRAPKHVSDATSWVLKQPAEMRSPKARAVNVATLLQAADSSAGRTSPVWACNQGQAKAKESPDV